MFLRWNLPTNRRPQWPLCRTERSFVIVPIVPAVCPPLYLMLILCVLGVEIRYVICLFIVMSAVTGRTHIDWRLSSITALLRLSVIRKTRHSAAQSQSDQSVYDTDIEVPSIDEPIPSVQVQSDKVESVVSEAPSAEASLSDFLYVTPGDRFEQLASTLLSQMRELSDRGLHPPVQSQPVLGSGSQPIVAATDQLGVSAPLEGIILPNPINPVFRLSTAPVSDETPVHRLAASDRKLQELKLNFAATRRAIDSFCDGGLEPPQSLVDSLSSLSRELVDVKRTSSELHGAIRPPSSQPGVSSCQQRLAAAAPAQPGPSQPEGNLSFAGPSSSRR